MCEKSQLMIMFQTRLLPENVTDTLVVLSHSAPKAFIKGFIVLFSPWQIKLHEISSDICSHTVINPIPMSLSELSFCRRKEEKVKV